MLRRWGTYFGRGVTGLAVLVTALLVNTTLIIVPAEWLWKLPFLGGGVPAIYWFYVAADAAWLPLISTAGYAVIALFTLSMVQAVRRQANSRYLLGLATLCFMSGIALGAAFPILLAQHTIHHASLRVRQHVYYVAAYSMFDINYRLFECDAWGLICVSRYTSGDLIGQEAWPGSLSYAPETNELTVIADQEGVIFTYSPP